MQLVLLGGAFTAISLGCLWFFVGILRQERRLANAPRVTGQLVGYETKQVRRQSGSTGGSRTVTQYYPVVAFQTVDGRAQQGASQYAWRGGEPGQQVAVEYAPDDPSLFRIAGNNVGRLGLLVLGPITGLFLVLGVVFLVVGARGV